MSPGARMGSVTRASVLIGRAPRSSAAYSSVLSKPKSLAATIRTTYGVVINTWPAMTWGVPDPRPVSW
jgi:hypothetical protein